MKTAAMGMRGLLVALMLTASARHGEEERQAKTVGDLGGVPVQADTSGLWGGHERPFAGRYRSHGGRRPRPDTFATPAGQAKLARRAAAEVRRVEGFAEHLERRRDQAEQKAREERVRAIEVAS